MKKFLISGLVAVLFVSQSTFALYYNGQVFTDHQAEDSVFDPEDGQEVTLTWTQDVATPVTIEIETERGEHVKTLISKKQYGAGNYEITWDGRDKYDETVDEGQYNYFLISDSPVYFYKTVSGEIFVNHGAEPNDDSVDPRLSKVYVSKEKWDPGLNEKNYLVFTLNVEADVSAELYDLAGNLIHKFVDEDGLPAGTYAYQIDNEELSGQTSGVTYRVYARNSKSYDTVNGEISFEVEEAGSTKPNIYKDHTPNGHALDPKRANLELSFYLDKAADITFEILDGDFPITTVSSNVALQAGSHSFYWNGKDKSGNPVDPALYRYRLTASNSKGKNVEYGNFSLSDSASGSTVDNCAGFNDVDKNFKYCPAITWAKNNGVFQGYGDGTFQPNRAISRVEAVKVVLDTMDVAISNKGNLTFSDTPAGEWYVDYLRTGLSLGIIRGYQDGTFKPNREVKRAEAAVIVLNTARVVDNIVIPSYNYGQPYFDTPNNADSAWYINYVWMIKEHELTDNDSYFYPFAAMTRAEMADFLHRYYISDLRK